MNLRVLIVEDSEDDALLLVRELRRAGHQVTSRRVEDRAELASAIAEGAWDIVLSDYTLPGFSGIDALECVKESRIDVPFVLVSGTITEESAVAAMKAGAHDWVTKNRLVRLAPAVEREIHEASVRREKKQAEEAIARAEELARQQSASLGLLHQLIEVSAQTLAETTLEGVGRRMVAAAIRLTGAEAAAFGCRKRDREFKMIAEGVGPLGSDQAFSEEDLRVLCERAERNLETTAAPSWSLGGVIATPLFDQDGAVNGVLAVDRAKEAKLVEQNKALLAQLAGLASLGLQHIEAREQAERRAAEAEAAEKEKRRLLHRQVDLTGELVAATARLATQNEELAAQSEELAAQNEELAVQQQELEAQNCELQAARDETARLFEEQSNLLRRLQETLLDIPAELPGVEFADLYRSATSQAQVGGDFYDVFEAKQGYIGLLIGDVSGHGVEAARVATLVKDTVHAFAHQFRRPHLVLRETNRLLVERRFNGFVTAFLAFLDPEAGVLTFCSAGHPAPLRALDSRVDSLECIGSPLGVFADASYRDRQAELEAGSLLLFYTDGITEARRDGDIFGETRLATALGALSRKPIDRLPSLLLEEAMDFSENILLDDVALLAVKYVGKRGISRK